MAKRKEKGSGDGHVFDVKVSSAHTGAVKTKTFEGLFEVFDVCARRLRNGNKLRIVLEAPYDKAEEKRLIDFKFSEVRMAMEKFEPQPDLIGIEKTQGLGMTEETEDELKDAGVL